VTTATDAAALPVARRRRPLLREASRERLLALLLMAPALLAVLVLVLYPLARVVEISLRIGRSMNFARISLLPLGLGNYRLVFADPGFWQDCGTTALYVGGSTLLAFAIGLATALLLDMRFPARRLFRTLLLLPWAVPGVVASIVFRWMFDGSFGVVNAILRDLHATRADIPWLAEGSTALAAVMVPTVWKAYPLITLTLLAALQTIPGELYEAADVDGASALARFRHVTWPGIVAAAILSVLVSALWIFRDIDIVFAATGGGPARATETLALYVYTQAFQYFHMGQAAAVGVVMVGTALLGAAFAVAVAGKQRL
jgi:multiple sugar transport system permease protein